MRQETRQPVNERWTMRPVAVVILAGLLLPGAVISLVAPNARLEGRQLERRSRDAPNSPRGASVWFRCPSSLGVQSRGVEPTALPAEAVQVKRSRRAKSKTSAAPKTSTKATSAPRRGWDSRLAQLHAFHRRFGHCRVKATHEVAFPGLYQWTRTIRSRHRHQMEPPPSTHDDTNCSMAPLERIDTSTGGRKDLTPLQLQALRDLDFVQRPHVEAWWHQYRELERFAATFGHCRVPMTLAIHTDYPGLGVWVRNQRRDYKRYQPDVNAANSTGTMGAGIDPERWAALHRLDFEWYQSHETAWMTHYTQLVQYQQTHGHCHVPQVTSLGAWCMNQRTAYKRHRAQRPTALTERRIELLNEIGFVWNVKDHAWQCMLQRLRDYYTAQFNQTTDTTTAAAGDGHVVIPLADTANRDLRLWLVWLRYCHGNQRRQSPTPSTTTLPRLSEARVHAVEAAIPNFCWSPHRKTDGGPSTDDWAKLFDAMRDKGIGPNVRPKQHWFEGMNPQSVQVKDVWTEQELLELWNQENDEGDEDDDYVDLRDRRDRGYN